MSKTAMAVMITGVVVTIGGVSYAVVRYRRRSQMRGADNQPNGRGAEDTAATLVPASTSTSTTSTPTAPAPAPASTSITSTPAAAAPASTSTTSTPTAPTSTAAPAPLPEPRHPLAHKRINWSHVDKAGTVIESPTELLTQATRFDVHIDFDELTGARLIASEHASGSFAELACIVDSELNRATRKRFSLYKSLTYRDTYGKQGGKRPASTRRDPQYRHLLAARAVLTGKARGISRGATRFFDPVAMERMNRKYRDWVNRGRQGDKPAIVSCDALTLLETWSFDLAKQGKNRCPPDRGKRGSHPLAWVGPIPSVNPLRLLLMKPLPLGQEHMRTYQAARDLLRRGLKNKE